MVHITKRISFIFLMLLPCFSLAETHITSQSVTVSKRTTLETQPLIVETKTREQFIDELNDLRMFLRFITENEKLVQDEISSLMDDVQSFGLKSAGYVLRGALDGLSFGLITKASIAAKGVGIAGQAALGASATKMTFSNSVMNWIRGGGLDRIKGLTKSVGMIGLGATANNATLPNYELQFAIPIWGSAVLANRFGTRIANAEDTLDILGDSLLELRKVHFRVEKAIEQKKKLLSEFDKQSKK